MGLAGCTPKAASDEAAAAQATAAEVELPAGAPKGTPATATWCAVPEAITDIAEEKSFDVVVVGAGIAGLSAAATAAENGASVAVIETLSTYQTRGQDIGTVNSSYQKANGLEASEEDINQMCLALQRYSGNRTDQRIYRVWGQRSGADFDWWYQTMLEPKGYGIEIPRWPMEVEYDPVDGEWFPQFCNQQEFTVPEGQEAGMNGGFPGAIGELEAYAKEHGAEFFYEHRGRQLVRGSNPNGTEGRVTGVIAETSDGSYVKFTAKNGVILATGDYGHNEDMMQAWCPSQLALSKEKERVSQHRQRGRRAPHGPVDRRHDAGHSARVHGAWHARRSGFRPLPHSRHERAPLHERGHSGTVVLRPGRRAARHGVLANRRREVS